MATLKHLALISLLLFASVANAQEGTPTATSTATSTATPTPTSTTTPNAVYITPTRPYSPDIQQLDLPAPAFVVPATVTSYPSPELDSTTEYFLSGTGVFELLATATVAVQFEQFNDLDGNVLVAEELRNELQQPIIDLFAIIKAIDWNLFGKVSIIFQIFLTTFFLSLFTSIIVLVMYILHTLGVGFVSLIKRILS